ncbi:hypothetical protein IAU60_001185 [Kwoniella sp. DSM 27419]
MYLATFATYAPAHSPFPKWVATPLDSPTTATMKERSKHSAGLDPLPPRAALPAAPRLGPIQLPDPEEQNFMGHLQQTGRVLELEMRKQVDSPKPVKKNTERNPAWTTLFQCPAAGPDGYEADGELHCASREGMRD